MAVFKMILGGRCKCGNGGKAPLCTCERDKYYTYTFRFEGKQYTRRTDCTDKDDAAKIERAYLKGLRAGRRDELLAFLQSDDSRMRRVCSSVGEVWDAYEAGWRQWLKNEQTAKRNLTDLALVIAHALDLWTVNDGGRRGVKKGAEVPDLKRIRAVSVGRLNRELVDAYFLARQIEAGIATETVPPKINRRAHESHAGFNSTLGHARDVFGSSSQQLALAHLNLPNLTEFLKTKDLEEGESLPDPFTSTDFAALCKTFDALRDSDPDLWLLNVISRQTGMRPQYVMGLRASWLEEGEGGQWYIKLKTRPEEGFDKKRGTLNQTIPITTELRDLIAARPAGRVIAGDANDTTREKLCKRHNHLIKTQTDEVGTHTQGSYRYRDTVASALAHLRDVGYAQWALGHRSSNTTLKHYAGALTGVSDQMKHELRAWLTARKPG